ncbi:MAG: glycoside hydrolase [Chloroflexota bacterium]|nr:glycoside hydrolase [Chloroflexota bacterium]
MRFRFALVAALVALLTSSLPVQAAALSFHPPVRLGYAPGDDWEPAIAADRYNHVYVMWKHYDTAAFQAANCGDPTGCDQRILVQRSSDGGQTWSAPRAVDPGRVGYDSQIAVDPVDGRTVYGAFLVGAKSSIGFTKSTDFGSTWTATTITETLSKGVDKPILAVRGPDVYIAWNAYMKIYVSVSHDGGRTWTTTLANKGGILGWSLPGGGTVAPNGDVYFSWGGYERNGGAKGPVNLYLTKSSDGGRTWTTILVDRSQAGPSCACAGWAYYSAQMVVASDAAGRLHTLDNHSLQPFGPGRLFYRSSSDGGRTWTVRRDLSLAPAGANNVFPAIATYGASGVRAAWMDNRSGAYKVYLRSSSDGGATWSDEAVLSRDLGYPYQSGRGFISPYGDYFELDVTGAGRTVATWGEGPSYDGPGNIFFTREQEPGAFWSVVASRGLGAR